MPPGSPARPSWRWWPPTGSPAAGLAAGPLAPRQRRGGGRPHGPRPRWPATSPPSTGARPTAGPSPTWRPRSCWATHGSPFGARRHGSAPVGRGGRGGRRGGGRGHRTAVRRRRGGNAGLGLALRGGVELAARDRVPGGQRGLRPGDGVRRRAHRARRQPVAQRGRPRPGRRRRVVVLAGDRLLRPADRGAARGLLGRLFAGERRWAGPWRPGPILAALAAAVVGALPWLYTNVGTSFASLRTSSLPDLHGDRLRRPALGLLPGDAAGPARGALRPRGAWAVGPVAGPVLYGALLVVVAASAGAGGGGGPARAAGGTGPGRGGRRGRAFPFVYAAVPSSGYWMDGRYGVALPLLVVLLVATAGSAVPAERGEAARAPRAAHASPRPAVRDGPGGGPVPRRWWPGRRLTVVTASAAGVPVRPRAFFTGWSDPEQPIRAAGGGPGGRRPARRLRQLLDRLRPRRPRTPGEVAVSPSYLDVVRWPAEARRPCGGRRTRRGSSRPPARRSGRPGPSATPSPGRATTPSSELRVAAGGPGRRLPRRAPRGPRRGGAGPPGDPAQRPEAWPRLPAAGRRYMSNACSCWASTRACRAAATAWWAGTRGGDGKLAAVAAGVIETDPEAPLPERLCILQRELRGPGGRAPAAGRWSSSGSSSR